MAAKTQLSTVHDLYHIQAELWHFLDARDVSREEMMHAQKQLRTFGSLLKQADWRYMGGEDVYDALRSMRAEVDAKLKKQKTTASRTRTQASPRFSEASRTAKKKATPRTQRRSPARNAKTTPVRAKATAPRASKKKRTTRARG